jgi:hypothetical protein
VTPGHSPQCNFRIPEDMQQVGAAARHSLRFLLGRRSVAVKQPVAADRAALAYRSCAGAASRTRGRWEEP